MFEKRPSPRPLVGAWPMRRQPARSSSANASARSKGQRHKEKSKKRAKRSRRQFCRDQSARFCYVLPETWVTVYSEDIGDTRPLLRRGHALEGVSRDGRATSICGPAARGRDDGGAVRGVRNFPQNGPQDLSAL